MQTEKVWKDMINDGLKPNVVTFTTLLSLYAKKGDIGRAEQVWDDMIKVGLTPNIASYNTLLSAYTKIGDIMKSQKLLSNMTKEGIKPDIKTHTSLLCLYANKKDIIGSEQVWEGMIKAGFSPDVASYNTLLSAYTKIGDIMKSEHIITTMINANIKPNLATYSTLLSLYARLGNIKAGKRVHKEVLRKQLWPQHTNYVEFNTFSSSLITMYVSCSKITQAREVFDICLKEKGSLLHISVWSSMISAYAQVGFGNDAIQLFETMNEKGVLPNILTFTSLLTACSHSLLPDKALEYVRLMKDQFNITPDVIHHNCVVDALARAGKLEEAENYIHTMKDTDLITWKTMLGACRLEGDIERGKRIADQIISLWPEETSSYVVLSNIFAANGLWSESDHIRKLMEERGLKKVPGISWMYIDGTYYEFIAADKKHPESEKIYRKVEELYETIKKAGFKPRTSFVIKNVKEDEFEKELCGHSEKLSIAFGMLKTKESEEIIVYKNLRICGDCHEATKWISKVTGRSINVKDARRWHFFRDGKCSCKDRW
jgi:pentatricopeptide repeat protein